VKKPDLDEPQQRTAMYFLIAEKIKSICVDNGYTAAVHGSLVNDLDIIVIPWTNKAIEPKDMHSKIINGIKGYINQSDSEPTEKPHGRLCWTIIMDWHAYIDLCIMPHTN